MNTPIRSRIETALLGITPAVGQHTAIFPGSSIAQLCHLAQLAERLPSESLIGEIGFNLGHSALAFLVGNSTARVISFDLGLAPHVERARLAIDAQFPGRLKVIKGDSRRTVRKYVEKFPYARFDLVFIDGGHSREIVRDDLANMRAVASKNTVLIIDDLVWWTPWGFWPSWIWAAMKWRGEVKEVERRTDLSGMKKRAWAVGRYISS